MERVRFAEATAFRHHAAVVGTDRLVVVFEPRLCPTLGML
jgi:hypothetical protein